MNKFKSIFFILFSTDKMLFKYLSLRKLERPVKDSIQEAGGIWNCFIIEIVLLAITYYFVWYIGDKLFHSSQHKFAAMAILYLVLVVKFLRLKLVSDVKGFIKEHDQNSTN